MAPHCPASPRDAQNPFSQASAPISPLLLEEAVGIYLGPPHCEGLQPAHWIDSPMLTAMGRDQLSQMNPCGCHMLPQLVTTWVGHCPSGWQGSRMPPRATATCHCWCKAVMDIADIAGWMGNPSPARSCCAGGTAPACPQQGRGLGHGLSCFGSHCLLSRLLTMGAASRAHQAPSIPGSKTRLDLDTDNGTSSFTSPGQAVYHCLLHPKITPSQEVSTMGYLPCSPSLGQPLAGKS